MHSQGFKENYTKCQDFKTVFGTSEGQIVLYNLMKESCFLRRTYVEGDRHASDLQEGMRNLFLYILWQVEMDPSEILENMRVQKEQEKANRRNMYADLD